jgi:Protein of unknown function (DUF2867)
MSRIAPPAESRISDWYPGASLVDSFAVPLPPAAPTDIDALATLLFADPPLWFTILLAIRDRVVTLFGVKASHALVADDYIAFFPVLSRSPDEITIGADDRHLDFRGSVLLRRAERVLVLTTAVHCHNRLGRAYLAVILPFHILVAKSLLSRLRRRFQVA